MEDWQVAEVVESSQVVVPVEKQVMELVARQVVPVWAQG